MVFLNVRACECRNARQWEENHRGSKIEKFTHSQQFLPTTHNLKIPIKVGFERRRCKDVGLGFNPREHHGSYKISNKVTGAS
jgi:hypothetical protein